MQQLVSRLADHEKDVQMVVENYRYGGNKLLDRFIRERRGALELNEAQLDQVRRQLWAALEGALGDVMDTLNGVSDGRREFTERWLASQRKVMDTAEQALSRCAEEG